MKVPFSWLKQYVDIDVSAQELETKLFDCGFEVEELIDLGAEISKVVVGVVTECVPQEGTHLHICKVDCGDYGHDIQISTGAANVYAGMHTPAALDGSTLPGGIKIKAKPLMGIESNGMLCSGEELGLNEDLYPGAEVYGLLDLPKDTVPGTPIQQVVGLDDYIFDISITANRADCQSVLGIAREVAAVLNKPLKMPATDYTVSDYKDPRLSITVEAPDLCPRYLGHYVRNITTGESPRWMRRQLALCGLRSISNVVDITNYVMEEYGQPMHAFDYDQLAGHEIVVKCASEGDVFQTLDGQDRTLDSTILMINDGEKQVGIAGIMGGENSKITDNVSSMVFECACFDGTNIRLSAKKLGLRTDASGKYEKGLDPNTAEEAVNRACQLIEELGAGEVVGGMIDVYPVKRGEIRIKFEPEKINKLLGTDISKEDMLAYFEKIDLGYDEASGEVVAPSWRQDLLRMADLAEEVARFYGYDKIPTTLPSGEATTGKLSYKLMIEDMARETAEFCGFSQGMTYSFESPKVFDKLLIPEDSELRKAITISNPLGEDFSIMRTLPLNGMLVSLSTNYNRRNKEVRLYELANVYRPKALPLTELPDERMQFTLGMYGSGDFFDMKGVVEEFFDKVGMDKKVHYDPKGDHPYLHPGRKADIVYEGRTVGFLGEIHPEVAENYKIGDRAYVAVIDMPAMTEFTTFDRKYTGIAKFPAVTRDISMVVPKAVLVGQIEDVISQRGGKILESCKLFDIYEGAQVLEGYKSVAYSITFRAKDHTLEEKEVTAVMNKILNGLKDLGIELRA